MSNKESSNNSDKGLEYSTISKDEEEKSWFLSKITQSIFRITKKIFTSLAKYIVKGIDYIIPPYTPLINLEKKLIPKEEKKDYTIIHHYNEIQIIIGFLLAIIGIITGPSIDELLWILTILGLILIFTGFEIEEIYITNFRLLVRRIGFIERVIRVPSDEEHLLEHVVSFNIGRAPMNKIITSIAAIGPILITIRELNIPGSIPKLLVITLLATSVFILIIGLRLGKRILVIYLAGGHTVILGQRKGIPRHILTTMMTQIYKNINH